MFKITAPEGMREEREYICFVLFTEMLRAPYTLELRSDCEKWTIADAGRSLSFDDSFLPLLKDKGLESSEILPDQLISIDTEYGNICGLYGSGDSSGNTLGIDIFGSAFFMLTRIEEMQETVEDKHGRFQLKNSVAEKLGVYHRALVDDYTAFLASYFDLSKPERITELTHDIDYPYCYGLNSFTFKNTFAPAKRGDLQAVVRNIYDISTVIAGRKKDPFDRFDSFMDIAEEFGKRAVFFFMTGGKGEYDPPFNTKHDRRVKRIIEHVKERGHELGIHFSYNADIENLYRSEKDILENIVGAEITKSRNHFLRFSVPETWRKLEDAGISEDYTCGFAEKPGYRCGTGKPYSVFDVEQRLMLRLREHPLYLMDATVTSYMRYSEKRLFEYIEESKATYGGGSLLWHNSSKLSADTYYKTVSKIDRE
ncbi:polysaccharide deacetylase family protein [Limisalsivibrio acetivorans]|uniref:polysaccharide deacetylase family protein n=1 Tax=Limisalsivibrio acetivorans TaxID=1304888 RepID=UPI0003B6E93B|nr:polysaccharide deacetylase family protein [Limisalsivibrio acetivorans]